MSERKGFKPMLASLMASATGFLGVDPLSMPVEAGRAPRKQHKVHTAPRYKAASSCGFRGFPRSLTPRGMVPAPTIDQVRFQEREYKCRLQVKHGLMYFKGENVLFDPNKALQRLAEREHAAIA